MVVETVDENELGYLSFIRLYMKLVESSRRFAPNKIGFNMPYLPSLGIEGNIPDLVSSFNFSRHDES